MTWGTFCWRWSGNRLSTLSCDQIILGNINYVIKYPVLFLSWIFIFLDRIVEHWTVFISAIKYARVYATAAHFTFRDFPFLSLSKLMTLTK